MGTFNHRTWIEVELRLWKDWKIGASSGTKHYEWLLVVLQKKEKNLQVKTSKIMYITIFISEKKSAVGLSSRSFWRYTSNT